MGLLGEEVNTGVSVLAGGRGGIIDAFDPTGTALEHQEVTQADLAAGDGDHLWGVIVIASEVIYTWKDSQY